MQTLQKLDGGDAETMTSLKPKILLCGDSAILHTGMG